MLRKVKSIYLESSVVCYLAARPSRDLVVAGNQQVTRDWWETRRGECDLFASDVVVAECAAGDPTAASEREVFLTDLPVLATMEEAEALAAALLSAMALPQRAALDALHRGLAAVNGVDILLAWNYAHIANPFMQPQINAACVEYGVVSFRRRSAHHCNLSRHRTMWKDPIVEETRSRREELARRFNYDIKAIGEALRRQQKASGRMPITRPPKRVKPTAA